MVCYGDGDCRYCHLSDCCLIGWVVLNGRTKRTSKED